MFDLVFITTKCFLLEFDIVIQYMDTSMGH